MSCAVTYLNPSIFPRLSLLTLAFPIFLAVNLAFVLFWLIFKASRVWLPLAGVALCWNFVRDYIPVNLPSPAPADTWKVITYNTCTFGGKEALDDEGHNQVVSYLGESNADIICLQETWGEASVKELRELLEGQGYEVVRYKGEMLCSRLHIIESDTLSFPTRSNGGFRALLTDDVDTLLLVNCHLESNHLSQEVKREYKDAVRSYESDSIVHGLMPMLRLLSVAAPMRAAQTDSIAAIIERNRDLPIIICGDFNDTPVSYTHRVLTRRLSSAYVKSGRGAGITFLDRGFPVRIDHILYDGNYFNSFDTHIDHSISFSDHSPVITFLAKKHENLRK